MNFTLVTLAENLAKTVQHQQMLLELMAKEHGELIGRANMESILEASRQDIEMVKICAKCLKKPMGDMVLRTVLEKRKVR